MDIRKRIAALLAVLVLAGCAATLPLPLDPATTAAVGGDVTMIQSACGEQLGHGYDVCRVTEGADVSETWTFAFPWAPGFVDGDLNIEYLGQTHMFKITGPSMDIQWRVLTGGDKWTVEHAKPAQARAALRFDAADGAHWVDLLGFAFPVVLKKGYAPLPFGSGIKISDLACTVQYSSAGRSVIRCQP